VESWTQFFKNFGSFNSEEINSELSTDDFYIYLSSLNNVFQINEDYEKYLNDSYVNFKWPDEPVIGLQIRRGEIVKNNGNIDESWNTNSGINYARPLYSIDEYMNGVEIINEKLNYKHIFVSTDSLETIDYLVENYPKYNFLYNNFNRESFLRYNGNPSSVALEFDIAKNEQLIKHYTDSCILDLLSLSKCSSYVGGMTHSEYGICGWFLQMCNQKSITPYFNVEGELDLVNGSLKMLLV
jgi:hypothetical protein